MKNRTLSFYRFFSIWRLSLAHVNENGQSISVVKLNLYINIYGSKRKKDEINILYIVLGSLVIQYSTTVQLKSSKLNKYMILKYEYENETLIYLWCSGDVEINPGPALRKFSVVPNSYKERRWMQDMISVSLKVLKGIPEKSKPKQLWREKPDNWPTDMPFYDPRNKSTANPAISTTDEQLLRCILECCQRKHISLPSCYQHEVNAWINGDTNLLIELHLCRHEIHEIDKAINILYTYRNTLEFDKMSSERQIQIDFGVIVSQTYESNTCKSDIIRDISVRLCNLCKGTDPFQKSDGIWKSPPHNWDPCKAFYNPYNAGKRTEKHQDHTLLNNLLEYCEMTDLQIPTEYELIIHAWKQHNMKEMRKMYNIQRNILLIDHSLKSLQFEGLLNKPNTKARLKNIGLIVTLDWARSNNIQENESLSNHVNKTQCRHESEKKTFRLKRQIDSPDLQDTGAENPDQISKSHQQDSYPKKKRIPNNGNETSDDQYNAEMMSLVDVLFDDHISLLKSTTEILKNEVEAISSMQDPVCQQIRSPEVEVEPIQIPDTVKDMQIEPVNINNLPQLDQIMGKHSNTFDQYLSLVICSKASNQFTSGYDSLENTMESIQKTCEEGHI